MGGTALPAVKRWSFTTAPDHMPPHPLVFTPQDGALDVPLNPSLVVVWDEALNPVTINPIIVYLGNRQRDARQRRGELQRRHPRSQLRPRHQPGADTMYIATLKSGIQDAVGNPTEGDFSWAFTTGKETDNTLGFTDAYFDYGVDSNGDGLYEQLVILAGVQLTAADIYTLTGTLADADGVEITRSSAYASYLPGSQFLKLVFDGAAIGGHGVDGPYRLTNLTLCNTEETGSKLPLGFLSGDDLYQTFAYTADQFPAVLRFSGLPDLWVAPGSALNPAFDVRDYAHHAIVSSDQLSYTLMANTDLSAGVTFTDNALRVNPQVNWRGSSDVTIQARYGADSAQDTFRVNIGWPYQVYLPVTLRNNNNARLQDHSGWRTAFSDDFEYPSENWKSYSLISIPPGGWYSWERRECVAYSGSHSAWAFGGSDDGKVLPCGSNYPNTLRSTMYHSLSINLKYTSAAEFSVKLWSNLAPGDQVCIMAATELDPNNPAYTIFYGNCRGGTTNGWQDFKLDLSQVPLLGNLLGMEKIWVAVQFIANESGTLPGGAYVDDALLRVCPVGLTCQP